MSLAISPKAFAAYRATAQRRAAEKDAAVAARRLQAHTVAAEAAALLRTEFGADEIRLFGSLAHGHWFSLYSDIDLAVRGVDADDFFIAVAHLQDLSPEFKIDLVDLDRCADSLRTTIEREGVVL